MGIPLRYKAEGEFGSPTEGQRNLQRCEVLLCEVSFATCGTSYEARVSHLT